MKFDESKVRKEWSDDLKGKKGYFSDKISKGNNCLRLYVEREYKDAFGIAAECGINKFPFAEYPFRNGIGSTWRYFYPIEEIKQDEEQKVIDVIIAGSSNVDCWVWNRNKKDGFRAQVSGFGNYKIGRMFFTNLNGRWYDHAIPYKEPGHEFKPFEQVLVRCCNESAWNCDYFSRKDANIFVCVGDAWEQCIPYAGNEKLLGTTDNPEAQE